VAILSVGNLELSWYLEVVIMRLKTRQREERGGEERGLRIVVVLLHYIVGKPVLEIGSQA
jgi:hypothetical protein